MRTVLIATLAALLLIGCGGGGEDGGEGEPAQPDPAPPSAPATPAPASETAGPAEEPETEITAAPLGSQENPIRCDMPAGERAYLDRLRCPDGSPPQYQRLGSFFSESSEMMLDGYQVLCGDRETIIYMDMYHPGYIENEPVPGFDIVQ